MASRNPGRAKTLDAWASELGCHVETLRRAARRRELLVSRDPLARGRPLVATATDVAAFLEKRRSV